MARELQIVGLGAGAFPQLTQEAQRALLKAKKIYCRYRSLLLDYFIEKHKKLVISFQCFYHNPRLLNDGGRSQVYEAIAHSIVHEALHNDGIVYALPGSVWIAETTPFLIYEIAKRKRLKVNTILGVSFIDVIFNSLPEKYRQDKQAQFSLVRAGNLHITPFNKNFSYILVAMEDMARIYTIKGMIRILSKHYSPDYKLLLMYMTKGKDGFSYRERSIEFKVKDMHKIYKIFRKRDWDGSLFVPASSSEAGEDLHSSRGHGSALYGDNAFLQGDLKFEEGLAYYRLGRYREALRCAHEALANSQRKEVPLLIEACRRKLP